MACRWCRRGILEGQSPKIRHAGILKHGVDSFGNGQHSLVA